MKKVGSFAAESQGFYRFLWEIVTLQAWSKSDSFLSQENHFKKQLALFNRWTILWPKSIKIVHLVFYESFNRWQNKYSDRFLLEKRREEKRRNGSLVLFDIFEIFHSQLITKWRHCYLQKTYLWLSAVLLEMSLSQKLHKITSKPCHRSLLSEKVTMKAFCSPSCWLVWK